MVAFTTQIPLNFKTCIYSPGWSDSVDWMQACAARGHQFGSQSGHMAGLRARYPVGACERQPHIDVSLPLFLPLFPSKIKFKTPNYIYKCNTLISFLSGSHAWPNKQNLHKYLYVYRLLGTEIAYRTQIFAQHTY